MIKVERVDSNTFKVVVQQGTTTTHTVTVTPDYYEKLTGKKVAAEQLVEKSFEFLLQRESNTSILRSFDLTVINGYFPEYERTIGQMLA
jgi:hypothetical protein